MGECLLGFIMIFWGEFGVAFGVAESPEGDSLYASPPGRSFYSCASSRAALHVVSLSLWDRQPSNAPPLLLSPAGLATRRGPHTKIRLGLCPKTPLTLSCGWIRSQGACGAFYFGPSRNQIKNQPYKRRLAPDPGGRRPSGRGVPTRRGSRGPPRVTFGYFSSQKSNPTPGRRANENLL